MKHDPTPKTEPAPARAQPPRQGIEVIKAFVKTLPARPGVYRMLDAKGAVLYVGKARQLSKRVASYAKLTGQPNRIARMISATAAMEVITTGTEAEALLLEANLIKRLKPRYNIVLRDDKSFPHILLTSDHEAPQVRKHRGAQKAKGTYYGPFASAGAVNRTLNALQRVFLLRSCKDSVYDSRTRPCLLYQIKRCAAPCTKEISLEDYGQLVDQARSFLKGRDRQVQNRLKAEMDAAAEALDFETAAVFRDRIRALTAIQSHQGINPSTLREADVIAAVSEGGQTCVQVFFFRSGQNWGNRAYYPRHDKGETTEEVMEAFLAQFYDTRPPPRLVLLSHAPAGQELLAEALSVRAERRVTVGVPQRGEKRQLVDHALENARESLARRLSEASSQKRSLEAVQDAFDLPSPPLRIECYDNSHLGGTNPVGAMVVGGPEGLVKGQYRKFNIKSTGLAPGDDYGMMREVLTRRFTRLMKDHPDREEAPEGIWPDLVLIDGGPGQLSVAQSVLDDLGITDVPLASISKEREDGAGDSQRTVRRGADSERDRFHMTGRKSFLLPPRSPALYYVQRLRDEAHRFAIGAQRTRRKTDIARTPLDEISGIGAGRKKALIQHFGSARAVQRAALSDLESVDGISKSLARRIYDHFRDG